MMTERYLLGGLHCAECGEKIRTACEKLGGVKRAKLNIAAAVLTVERTDGEPLTDEIQLICDRTEGGITVRLSGGGEPAPRKRFDRDLIPLIIGGAAAVTGIIMLITGLETAAAVCFGLCAAVTVFEPAREGIRGLMHLETDENLLLFIAVCAALIIGEYTEAAAVSLLFAVGERIESAVSRRSRKELELLGEIRPDTVHTDTGDKPACEVVPGEIITVRAGERIPLDGTVIGGSGTVDASSVTGESLPVTAEYGTSLLGGMLNGAGVLKIKVTGDYESSAAARIVKLVEQSAERKGSADRFMTRFARIYTPLCVLAAVLITVIPWIVLGAFSTEWLRRSLVFLVASCPCALVISVPLAFYAGIGAASKRGVLIKGGVFVEALAACDAVGFDKTGTLTSGRLKAELISGDPDVLCIAAAAESDSVHPVAAAIRAACKSPASLTGEVTEYAGCGVEVKGDRRILVGAARLMEREGIDISKEPEAAVYVAVDGRCIGAIAVTDTLRNGMDELIRQLTRRKVRRIALLSGDSPASVKAAADAVGISEAYGGLLPADKVRITEDIKRTSGSTVFVGDGINDAPVLAAATVGVAMGLGTDAAIETADAVLCSGSPDGLLTAIDISRRTMRVVHTNIALCIGIKLLVMLSAFFVPMMWAAVVADVVLNVVCSLNAARLLAPSKA